MKDTNRNTSATMIALSLAALTLHVTGCGKSGGTGPIDPVSMQIVEKAVRGELNKPLGKLTDNDLGSVTYLLISDPNFSDLRTLAKLVHLQYLYVLKCKGVADISPLLNLKELAVIEFKDCSVTDLLPLQNLPNLQSVTCVISGNRKSTPVPTHAVPS